MKIIYRVFIAKICVLSFIYSQSILAEIGKGRLTESNLGNGVISKIIISDRKRIVLGFSFPVSARVGETYQTNIDDLSFKVMEISPRSDKVFGVFNHDQYGDLNEIIVFGVSRKNLAEKSVKRKKLSYSIFYTMSFGSFNEETGNVSTKSSQDSPFTIGGSLNYKLTSSLAISGSTYFSKLNSAISINNELQNSNKSVNIPWEYGITSYVEYVGGSYYLKPYIGLDFESFSTFNTDELRTDPSIGLDVRTHSFTYATLGVFGFTKFFKKSGIFKASFSTNFTSSSTRLSKVSNKMFNGQKFILFFASNIWENWGASLLYKQHMMSGPTDLTISRFGIGVSYKFQ